MTLETLQAFFLWCTVINGGLLLLSFLICAYAGEWVYRMHGKWFPISREAFYISIYRLLGSMKSFVLMLNLVPYVVLVIIS